MKTITAYIFSALDTAPSLRREAEKSERQKETSPQNSLKLRTSVEKDQLDRNEMQPFNATPSNEAIIKREESKLATHRSNQNTGVSKSQVDHDETPRSVSQHTSNNVRSPFNTTKRRKRASEHA